LSKGFPKISVKNILVAVDGSEHAKKAVMLAIDTAKMWNATVHVIHVQERLKIPKEFETYAKIRHMPVSSYFSLVCQRDQFLGETEAKIKEAGVKVANLICIQGDPGDEIIKAAKNNKADLIIMGNRGLGKFSTTFMGSVSSKVCNHAACTCITVK
jgi:nucleotide-binding universal stress UspA family protein